MTKIGILILVGMISIVSCSVNPFPQSTFQITGTSLSTATQTITPLFVPMNSATITPLLPTVTQAVTRSPNPRLPTITPTVPPEVHLIFQCLEIAPNLPAGGNVKGTLVLTPAYPYNNARTYLWNMETSEKHLWLNEPVLDYITSPNGRWLAFWGNKSQQGNGLWLTIVTADGKEQKVIKMEEGWGHLALWLDNQRLLIRNVGEIYKSTDTARLVLNPFTGERQELPPDPLDIYNLYPVPQWQGLGMSSYDPGLTRRVYPNIDYDLVLEDLQTHQVLVHFLVPIFDAIPRWSPDGQSFVITKATRYNPGPDSYELFNISRDGEVSQLTHLADHYENAYIASYHWSPDGQYIAFWLAANPENDHQVNLAVLDIKTLDMVVYCITSNYKGTTPPNLFWSPNSQQLVMDVTDENEENPVRVVIVDIVHGWAAQIAEDVLPVGWMINP